MSLNGKTKVYGIIGDPVDHSLSPAMHNAAYAAMKMNAVFVAFPTKNATKAIFGAKELGISGLAITAPFKAEAASCCDEIFGVAKDVGVVNTLLFDEIIKGFNTDVEGILESLIEGGLTFSNQKTVIIGGGGTAKAAVAALFQTQSSAIEITFLARNHQKTKSDFQKNQKSPLNFTFLSLGTDQASRAITDAGLIINATPIGLADDALPIDPSLINKNSTILDVNYRKGKTPLLRAADKIGANTIGGERLLINQAVSQFKLFTGKDAPKKVMENAVLHGLEID